LGLNGDYGTLLAGRMANPVYGIGRKYDLFSNRVGDTRALSPSGFDSRSDNVITYITPKYNGLSFGVGSVVTEKTVTSVGGYGNTYFANASYNKLTYMLDLAHSYTEKGSNDNDMNVTRFGASTAIGNSFGLGGSVTNVSTNNDINLYSVGATYGLDYKTLLKSQYSVVGGSRNTNATILSLGLDYSLTKNTVTYATYSYLNNEGNASYTLGGVTTGHGETIMSNVGKDVGALSVGMIHKF